jgi:hypothetical protein
MPAMEEVIRNVADIDSGDRLALEHLIGKHLAENQQVVISVMEVATAESRPSNVLQTLEDWTHIYDGLGDEEIEAIDKIANTRANLTRNLP